MIVSISMWLTRRLVIVLQWSDLREVSAGRQRLNEDEEFHDFKWAKGSERWQPTYLYIWICICIAIAWAVSVHLYFMFEIFQINVQTESSTLKTLTLIYSKFIIKKLNILSIFWPSTSDTHKVISKVRSHSWVSRRQNE